MKDYRKIWSDQYGPIPVDELGRTYDIHHIDGNRENNDISNLKAVSLQEHYEIHFNQGDYASANMIAFRIGLEIYSGYTRPEHGEKMKEEGNPMWGKRGEDCPHWGKKRPDHSKFLKQWWKENPNYDRGQQWKNKLSASKLGMVTCKDENGNYLCVSKSEFENNPNLVGVSKGNVVEKKWKKIRCIEDNIIFESIKAADKHYGGLSGIVDNLKGRKRGLGKKKLGRCINFEYINN